MHEVGLSRDLALDHRPGGKSFNPLTLSFADCGRKLAAFGYVRTGYEMIAVSPAWRGGTFASGRVIFSGSPGIQSPSTAVLGPDGKTVILAGLQDSGGVFPRNPPTGWIDHGKLIPLPGIQKLPIIEAW